MPFASRSRTSSRIASPICKALSLMDISSRGKDQLSIVTGPVSIPFIGLSVRLCAYFDQSVVIGFALETSPQIIGGFTQRVP